MMQARSQSLAQHLQELEPLLVVAVEVVGSDCQAPLCMLLQQYYGALAARAGLLTV
jgi:hypothetical protein